MKATTKKPLRRFAIVFGGFVLLVAIFLAEEHIRGRIELNRYLTQMRAQGEKFTIAELTPIPAPPEKNGAGLLMGTGFAVGKVAPAQLPPSMRYIAPGLAVAAAREPAWAIRKQGTFIPTNGVVALWRTNNSTDTPRIGGTNLPMLITSEDLAADVRAVTNSLAQVHAALQFPALDHGLDYSVGFNILLPHLSQEKNASQWLRTASLNALFETNHAAVLQNLLALAAFAHLTTNEPLMISQLVRIAIHQIGVSATWEALQVDGWTENQLRELQTAMQSSDFVIAMARTFEMERAMGLAAIDRAAEDSDYWANMFDINSQAFGQTSSPDEWEEIGKNIQRTFLRLIYLPAWRMAWKDQEKLRLARHWQTQIEMARTQARLPNWEKYRPKNEQNSEDPSDWRAKRFGGIYDRICYPLSSMLGDLGGRSMNRAVDAEVARELALTVLALNRWHLAQGKFPATLQELVPQFLAALPVDPYDGQSLRYRRNDDETFLLYSVGHDGKDDGGSPVPITQQSRPRFLDTRDIVWPRAATAEEIEKINEAEAGRSRRPRVP